jgi:transposase
MEESVQAVPRGEFPRRERMETPEEVAAMLRLKTLGWGIRWIARELGCSHMTVRRYVMEGGWVPHRGRGRPRTLAGHEQWLAERFRRHAGNARPSRARRAWRRGTLNCHLHFITLTRSAPKDDCVGVHLD